MWGALERPRAAVRLTCRRGARSETPRASLLGFLCGAGWSNDGANDGLVVVLGGGRGAKEGLIERSMCECGVPRLRGRARGLSERPAGLAPSERRHTGSARRRAPCSGDAAIGGDARAPPSRRSRSRAHTAHGLGWSKTRAAWRALPAVWAEPKSKRGTEHPSHPAAESGSREKKRLERRAGGRPRPTNKLRQAPNLLALALSSGLPDPMPSSAIMLA